jgi:AraC-like DNA-binding protein
VLKRESSERAIVQKGRDYIDKHKTERLSLSAVAQAADASVFHFCKAFRKTTGMKFTDYVARVRLQDACTQLRNRDRRISEVAYDAGFQSITQFNRTFKRVFGQSPTAFRAQWDGEPK